MYFVEALKIQKRIFFKRMLSKFERVFFKRIPFELSIFNESQLQIKYWCVSYDSVLCGMGKTKKEAYYTANLTLSAIGLRDTITKTSRD